AVLWAWKRNPPLGFLGVWFFLILVPTSSFLPIADLAVEHRMYLSLAAVAALVVIGGFQLAQRWRISGAWRAIAGTLVVLALTAATIGRNKAYSSELAMWEDTVAKRPQNPRAQYDLGT